MIVQWEGDKKTLILLREIFRRRMQEVDFCIGEERVEELFRALLNEPIKEEIIEIGCAHTPLREFINKELDKLTPKVHEMFNKNHSFYKRLK